MATISVVMSSYNDASFIKEAISSVLNQSYEDFEFIIVENGSTDNSLQILTDIRDPRLSVTIFPVNKGSVVGMNAAITQATGKYVALLNSDDYFLPDKLRIQVQYLDSHPAIGAVFGMCHLITEEGITHPDPNHGEFFRHRHLDRSGYLRYFFFNGNCLCHPTAMIRRDLISRIGLFDIRLRRMPDFDYWIRILLNSDFAVLDTQLAAHRYMDDASNESGARPDVEAATAWEYAQILHHYLSMDEQTFSATFQTELDAEGLTGLERRVQLGKIAIHTQHVSGRAFGLRMLYDALTDHAPGVTATDFHDLTGTLDVFGLNARARCELLETQNRKLTSQNQNMVNELIALKRDLSALTSSKTYRYTTWGRRLYRFVNSLRLYRP